MGMKGASNYNLLQAFARLCQAAKEDRLRVIETTCASTGQARVVLVIVADTSVTPWRHEPVGHLVDNPMSEYARPIWANKPEEAGKAA